ncbi:MAG: efflux RND transporter periplasmic adaptor subunit [Deltaproteobacteria bacterium]|nr:efflux RND transporter periplasmic adaptor subunit [Deltaproteobacteria bacterium]
MRLAVAVVVLLFAGLGPGALAHGGEDHGAPPPPPMSGDSGTRTASASTSAVELVARWPAVPAEQAFPLRVLISDFETNAPVEGAAITLDLSDPKGASLPSLTLAATTSPGIYEAKATATLNATHAGTVTIVAGDLVDVVALPALVFGPPAAPVEAPHEHGLSRSLIAAIVVAALLGIILVAFGLRRRRRRSDALVAAAAFFVVVGFNVTANAHGGEDHGEAKPTSVAGPVSASTVFLQKESQFLLGIRTARAALSPVSDRLEVPGVITAPPEGHAAVFAAQQGRVLLAGGGGKGVPMLGSVVKKGQLLAVLEAALTVGERASFSVEAAQAESEVAAAEANKAAAERNVTRLAGLEGVVSQRERDEAGVELKEAQAALSAAEAKRAAFGSTERSTRVELRAPIDGVLADVDVSPGQLVEPGRRAFLIVDPAVLWVEAKVYEADLARLSTNAHANIVVDAWPAQQFRGELLALGEVVDPDTRTVKALFRVENQERRLKLGMFARVQIGAGAAADVLVVPESAVLDVDGRRLVFVHTAPEEFQSREIAVGRRDGDKIEVRAGLAAGERVVISGLLSLKNAPPAPAQATPTPAAVTGR